MGPVLLDSLIGAAYHTERKRSSKASHAEPITPWLSTMSRSDTVIDIVLPFVLPSSRPVELPSRLSWVDPVVVLSVSPMVSDVPEDVESV